MTQRLNDVDARRIAALARLQLSSDEIELFSRQLADILAYVDALQAADTTGIEPTSHPLPVEQVWRDDKLVPSLDRAAVLAHAPGAAPDAGLFKVPKVL